MTAVEGNASFYQVNPVGRITGDGSKEFLRTWGPDFDQKGDREGTDSAAQVLRKIYVFSCYLSSPCWSDIFHIMLRKCGSSIE